VNFTNTTISGFTTLDVTSAGANDITLDAASVSGTTTIVANAGANLLITETGNYTNLTTTSGDFDNLTLTDGITATVDEATLDADGTISSMTAINSSGAVSDANLVINMVGTTLSLGAVAIGAVQDVDTTITGTTGDDIIVTALSKAAGSAMTIDSGTGNDQVRLLATSGNGNGGMVIADAVSISHDANSDQVAMPAAFLTNDVVNSRASGAVTAGSDGFVFINDATVNDFSVLAQFAAAVGALTDNASSRSLAFAIPNNTGSQVGIYVFTDSDNDANVGDVAADVELVAVLDISAGTFNFSDIAVY